MITWEVDSVISFSQAENSDHPKVTQAGELVPLPECTFLPWTLGYTLMLPLSSWLARTIQWEATLMILPLTEQRFRSLQSLVGLASKCMKNKSEPRGSSWGTVKTSDFCWREFSILLPSGATLSWQSARWKGHHVSNRENEDKWAQEELSDNFLRTHIIILTPSRSVVDQI